ncbi:hypothetical protein DM01DRAFT_1411708 [Hesseltinella vesiculosa]|uniref:Alpha/beta hydrolase fold-3 domain-containing protein n=1 Tax=Hesseltinella vesiculosa TaxID=101127 RepID=A0A1X2G2V2_9FUNG|nr:hypothetical protein DM01DRAFT_1411708 [Hesseltinella vesiculosa]
MNPSAHPAVLNALINHTGLPVTEAIKPRALRQFFKEKSASVALPSAVREHRLIGEQALEIVIVRPPHSEGQILPILLFVHGGGFYHGNIDTHAILTHKLARRTPALVVHVEFSLSPEVKHPVAIEQCFTALEWINRHGTDIGGDLSKLAIVGDSTGANMVAAVTALAKDRGNTSIQAQVLLYPTMGLNFATKTREEYKEDGLVTRQLIDYVWQLHLPAGTPPNRFAFPLLATIDQLKGLPPALIIMAENDVLRDDGEAYHHKLISAGVASLAVQFYGVRHGFMVNPKPSTASEAGIDQIVAFLRAIWKRKHKL